MFTVRNEHARRIPKTDLGHYCTRGFLYTVHRAKAAPNGQHRIYNRPPKFAHGYSLKSVPRRSDLVLLRHKLQCLLVPQNVRLG